MHGAVWGGQWGYFERTGVGTLIVVGNLTSKQSEFSPPMEVARTQLVGDYPN